MVHTTYVVLQYTIQNEFSDIDIIKFDKERDMFTVNTQETLWDHANNKHVRRYVSEYPYSDKESMILTILRYLPPIYGEGSANQYQFYIQPDNSYKYTFTAYACIHDNTPMLNDTFALYCQKRQTIENKIEQLLDILTLDEKFESTPARSQGQQHLNGE